MFEFTYFAVSSRIANWTQTFVTLVCKSIQAGRVMKARATRAHVLMTEKSV